MKPVRKSLSRRQVKLRKLDKLMKLLLPSLLIVFICAAYIHPQISIGQTNTNFLTYTNTELGFTIDYPSGWRIVEDIYPGTVSIRSPDFDFEAQSGFRTDIQVNRSELQSLTEVENIMIDDIRDFSNNLTDPDVRLVEVNSDTYYLGGHPAVRIILVFTPLNQIHEERFVDYETLIDGKQYGVAGAARATLFPEFETIFQQMVESFKAIKFQ
jgi:hypothetical protein